MNRGNALGTASRNKPDTAGPGRTHQEPPLTAFMLDRGCFEGAIGWAREWMTDPAKIDRRPLHTILLPAPWHRGRVLVIGDAARATTPHLAMGAGIAIEDAVVLGEVLSSYAGLGSA